MPDHALIVPAIFRSAYLSSTIVFFQDGNCSKMNPDDSPISGIDNNPGILPGK
jgi:hypothetical protein